MKQFRGEEAVAGEENKVEDGESITVERLEQLLMNIQLDDDQPNSGAADEVYQGLSQEEKQDFERFLQKQANEVLDVWEPWWIYRSQLATQAIEEVGEQNDSSIDYNMNRFGQERLTQQEGAKDMKEPNADDGDADFEDVSDEDEG